MGEHHRHPRLALKRGDIVVGVHSGARGKPRPGVIVQSDDFNETHASIVVCPITSEIVDAPAIRIPLLPSAANGLRKPSQIMVDKIAAMPRERIANRIGRLDASSLNRLDVALSRWLGLPLRG